MRPALSSRMPRPNLRRSGVASLVEALQSDAVPLEVHVEYQACGEGSWGIPRRETLRLRVPIAPQVANDLAGDLPGAVRTTMRSRWFMLRMLIRAWRESPVRGLRHLTKLWMDIQRGPSAGRWAKSRQAR